MAKTITKPSFILPISSPVSAIRSRPEPTSFTRSLTAPVWTTPSGSPKTCIARLQPLISSELGEERRREELVTMADSQCCQNPPTLSSASGEGSVLESFGGLKAYVTGSPDSNKAILLISDVFGYGAPNLRKLADKTAAAGFFVVVPDFFYGDPFDHDKSDRTTWFQAHGTDKGFEDAKPIVAALKDRGISVIGVAGFCWGGKVVADLSKSGDIQAAVMLHPSRVTVEDMKEIKAHIAVLGAEIDRVSPPELLKQFEEVLSVRPEVDSYVKIFPGVEHGWTVRYDINDESAVKSAEESHKDMIEWFVKYLK